MKEVAVNSPLDEIKIESNAQNLSTQMANLVDALLIETVMHNQQRRLSHEQSQQETSDQSESEYTYEEVEVEIFETDDSADDEASGTRRMPDTIFEPQITETDDQIPDCVLESDQTSRFSCVPFDAESIPSCISEDSCDVTTTSCQNLTDFPPSSRAEMADDEEENCSRSASGSSEETEYEEIEIEVTDSECEEESEVPPPVETAQIDLVDNQAPSQAQKQQKSQGIRPDSEKSDASSKSLSNKSILSVINVAISDQADCLEKQEECSSSDEDEYEEIELEVEVTASESESEDDEAEIDSLESSKNPQNDVSLASVSIWNDSSYKSSGGELSDDSHASVGARSAPIPISRKKRFKVMERCSSQNYNMSSPSPRMRTWIKNGFNASPELEEPKLTSSAQEGAVSPPKSRVHLLKRSFPSFRKKSRTQSETSDTTSQGSQREDCSLQ